MMWLRSSMSPFRSSFPGQEYAYKSIDCILMMMKQYNIPLSSEFHSDSDLQAHNLILKVGAPIMLTRNIDAPGCECTRLIVKSCFKCP
ncbi:hypothetical protein TNIN_326261 [Trichonephila inaurata madagascariensis]|uniref:DNA helicase Pif1-like 2B domain-containing protein n=1 Tax=Trichonephila inaurata madagascariensis TaxID=2747483 RepID=A0A8X7BNE7_9ARAC|nr:hypothetical protein TNIN_326261 [Trichonephila inaurata madagascariensis]